jgi:hypothetical protein
MQELWKPRIIENLKLREVPLSTGVPSFEKLTISALLALSTQFPVQTKYVIEEKSAKDIEVLWLSVGHCELNPIELAWSDVKRYIAKNNKDGGPQYVLNLAKVAIAQVTPEK